MMKNVAIIGFGFIGIMHTLNIQRNKFLNVAAIITRDITGIEQKLKSQVGNFSMGDVDIDFIKSIPVYATLKECLHYQKLDAVHICVHTDLHYSLAKEALEHGLHVLLEKPMSLDLQECKDLIYLAKEKSLILMIGHVLRFMSPYQKMKEWIDSREFGPLKFLSLSRFSGLPSWGQWKEKQQNFGTSGGALFDLLIHDIDFLNYALGKPNQIKTSYLPGSLSRHDYINALWSYTDRNITAKLEGGNIFHSAFPFQAGYMANFEKASVLYSTTQPEFIQIATHEESWKVPAGDANEGFYKEIAYFASCMETLTWPHECPPESSLETIELCYKHIETP